MVWRGPGGGGGGGGVSFFVFYHPNLVIEQKSINVH
jgi:hypothetical protein